MGVLEDAIREHLDLKRQHGASDEELTRQEAEALGPARRELLESEAEDRAPETAETEAAVEAPPVTTDPVVEPAVEPPPIEEPSAGRAQPKDEDPDFGADTPDQTSRHDLDFD
jgi:hypothetical protein